MNTNDLISKYTTEQKSQKRIAILRNAREKGIYLAIPPLQDFLNLPISEEEKSALIMSGSNWNNLYFEDFYTKNIFNWNQNLASTALWEWVHRSDCLLWHRTIIMANDHRITQRLGYTLLNISYCGSGSKIIDVFTKKDDLWAMSDAFISILLYRALQFDYYSEILVNLSLEKLLENQPFYNSGVQPISFYLAYLYRFATDKIASIKVEQPHQYLWTQINATLIREIHANHQFKAFKSLLNSKISDVKVDHLINNWLPIWDRHKLTSNDIQIAINLMASAGYQPKNNQLWEYFAGVQHEAFIEAIESIEDETIFKYSIKHLHRLFDHRNHKTISDRIKLFVSSTNDFEGFITSIPKRFSAFQNLKKDGNSDFDRAFREQEKTISQDIHEVSFQLENFEPRKDLLTFRSSAQDNFFGFRFFNRKIPANIEGDDFWSELLKAWKSQDVTVIDKLSNLARQQPHLYQLCYIDTLGRFVGSDKAALKLLDYIRSEEPEVIYAVIYALKGINTNRSTQELISCLTRPNLNKELKFEVAQLLEDSNLTLHQAELRNAIEEIKLNANDDPDIKEMIELLSDLIKSKNELKSESITAPEADSQDQKDIDQILEDKIESFLELSGEAKRALRTAQFFHSQLQYTGKLHTIDLSPAIDMQYKALELSFREKFEDVTGRLIRSGVLQRKLDLIGYARPSMQKMDEFERYIESLDIIKTIPFFSRFKLRKMLRGICLFRPGKRFTLDGLKAFALFFLCFSRKECPFGLSDLMPAPSFSDAQLSDFCKSLHTFQDFRNRAAHEGFHPSASNDLDSIWMETSNIINNMLKLEQAIKESYRKTTKISQTG